MEGFLQSIPILPELGAFVALVIIFLLFRIREIVDFNRTLMQISAANLEHAKVNNIENLGHAKAITDEFQAVVKEQNREFRASLKLCQDRVRDLTNSHVMISRDLITAFAGVETAFRTQLVRLESLSVEVRDFRAIHNRDVSEIKDSLYCWSPPDRSKTPPPPVGCGAEDNEPPAHDPSEPKV